MVASVSEFKSSLRQRGYKLTLQRMAIYEALRDGPRHPTAEEVHAFVSQRYPMIGLSTVYNTLETLCELGLAKKIAIDPSVARYDMDTSNHAHLVCAACNKIIDFTPPHCEICAKEITDRHGYSVIRQESVIFGYCPRCTAEREAPKAG